MMVDHADLRGRRSTQCLAARHAPFTTRCVFRALLALLPPAEGRIRRGTTRRRERPELPDGTLVRISRVMYPDGQIYKVMSDAPNGGPQWVEEDIRPELYVPFTDAHTIGGGTVPPTVSPVDLTQLLSRIENLERHSDQLHSAFGEVSRQIGALNSQIAELAARPAQEPLPDYIGQLGPVTIISKPRR